MINKAQAGWEGETKWKQVQKRPMECNPSLGSAYPWLRTNSEQAAIHYFGLPSLATYKTAPVNFGLNNNLKLKESDKRAVFWFMLPV